MIRRIWRHPLNPSIRAQLRRNRVRSETRQGWIGEAMSRETSRVSRKAEGSDEEPSHPASTIFRDPASCAEASVSHTLA